MFAYQFNENTIVIFLHIGDKNTVFHHSLCVCFKSISVINKNNLNLNNFYLITTQLSSQDRLRKSKDSLILKYQHFTILCECVLNQFQLSTKIIYI